MTIYLYAPSYEKVYDGDPLVPSAEDVDSELLPEGYSFTVTLSGSQTDAGESDCTIASCVIRDGNGNNVTDFCNVICESGSLTVTKYPITFSTSGGTYSYGDSIPFSVSCTGNGNSLSGTTTESGYDYFASYSLVGDDKIEFAIGPIPQRGDDADTYYLDISYSLNGDSNNYSVHVNEGSITISPLDITFSSSSDTKTYDGYPLYPVETSWIYPTHDEFSIGYREVGCSKSDAGTYNNEIDIDYMGHKESNYNITKNYGTFTINQRNVTITSGSDEKQYDGSPLTYDYYDIDIDGGTVGDEWFSVSCTGSQTEIGSSENTFTVSGIGGANLDNYNINEVYGTLTVTEPESLGKPALNIHVPDRSKTYDGQPFSEQIVEASEGSNIFITYPASSDANVGTTSGITYTVSGNTDAYELSFDNSTVSYTINPYSITFDLKGTTLDASGHWTLAKPTMNGTSGTVATGSNTYNLDTNPAETVTLKTSVGFVNSDGYVISPLTAGTYPITYSYSFSGSKSNYSVSVNNPTYIITGTAPETDNPGSYDPEGTEPGYTDPSTSDGDDPPSGYTPIT